MTKRSRFSVKNQGCAFLSSGTVTEMQTVKMQVMSHPLVVKLSALRITLSATIPSASLNRGSVTVRMTVETTLTKTTGMLVVHQNFNVTTASGSAQELQNDVSMYHGFVMASQTAPMEQMKAQDAPPHPARTTKPVARTTVM